MNVQLYINKSADIVVKKDLEGEITLENVRFKDDNSLNVKNPTLICNYWQDVENARNYNYLYIPKFKSYYYIDRISWSGSLAVITTIKRDVLMTVKNDILNSTQYIVRQEHKKNKYLQDDHLPIISKHNYLVKTFGDNVEDVGCTRVILETSGMGVET